MNEDTRLFFVVVNNNENEEIFETYGEALDFADSPEKGGKIWIALVNNAYKEEGEWNYNDLADTFEFIKQLQ